MDVATTGMDALTIDASSVARKSRDDDDASRALFCGLFLTEKSRKALPKPVLKQKFGDHVTFLHSPSRDDLNLMSQAIGRLYRFRLVEELTSSHCQLVTIELEDDKEDAFLTNVRGMRPARRFHVTISTSTGVAPNESNTVIETFAKDDSCEEIKCVKFDGESSTVLSGTFGVMFRCNEGLSSELTLLDVPEEIMSKVLAFVSKGVDGDTMTIRNLTPKHRFALHAFAKSNGLQSHSEGPKSDRRFILRRAGSSAPCSSATKECADAPSSTKKKKKKVNARYLCTRKDAFRICLTYLPGIESDVTEARVSDTGGEGGSRET